MQYGTKSLPQGVVVAQTYPLVEKVELFLLLLLLLSVSI